MGCSQSNLVEQHQHKFLNSEKLLWWFLLKSGAAKVGFNPAMQQPAEGRRC
jgi:hypothetical protein